MTNQEIIESSLRYVANTYARFPIAIVRGLGTRVWDADGRQYLDFVAGLAVTNLGHCHPRVVSAIKGQAEKLIHISNLYHIGPQAEFAKLLCENSFADRVFFCNSGAEANEAAIKLARKYFSLKGERRSEIITMEKSFHGRTLGTLAATAQKKVQEGFEPLLERFTYVPFGDIGALKKAITEKTAAILIEPIQGEGGVNIAPEGYLFELKAFCKEKGILLIFDEVQVGMGRTGRLFSHEHYNVAPDIMTLAKGLAGGVAIGAMLATEEIGSAFTPGAHASTFGGNPLATAAGIAVIQTTLEDGILENTMKVGAYLLDELKALKEGYPFIKDVRGIGLIIGMELTIPGADIVKMCMDEGLLINCTAEKVLRFLPALIVKEAEVKEMLAILEKVFDKVVA
ncbi:MAG: aspartate aminotransferase family protein [Deltaproteobacteria bacterium]|nr:aspartate aminotransferase family protein [Deltaproteobacteria bacterium]